MGKRRKKQKKQYQNKRQRAISDTEAEIQKGEAEIQKAILRLHRIHRCSLQYIESIESIERMRNLEKYGNNHLKEYIAIRQIDLCLKKFCLQRGTEIDLQRTFEGAHNDVAIRFEGTPLRYAAFQVKSTLCRDKWGSANFNKTNIYPKSVLVCVVLNPLEIFVIPGRDLTRLSSGGLGIGRNSDYDMYKCVKGKDGSLGGSLVKKLKEFYATNIQTPQELSYWDVEKQTPEKLLEHRAHTAFTKRFRDRESIFERPKVEHSHVDSILGDYMKIRNVKKPLPPQTRIQEKVCRPSKKTPGLQVSLRKKIGPKKYGPYWCKDFDLLLVFWMGKKNGNGTWEFGDIGRDVLLGYWAIPMTVLEEKGYVKNGTHAGKQTMTLYPPVGACKEYGWRMPRQKSNLFWTRKYFKRADEEEGVESVSAEEEDGVESLESSVEENGVSVRVCSLLGPWTKKHANV